MRCLTNRINGVRHFAPPRIALDAAQSRPIAFRFGRPENRPPMSVQILLE